MAKRYEPRLLQENTMNIRFATPLVAAAAFAVAALAVGFANVAQAGELTRAQVRAELAQLRAAGYDQSVGEDVHYPEALQLAQARVNATQASAQAQAQESSSYGGAAAGTSVTGAHRFDQPGNDGMKPIYFGQ
jgi:type II secretory pathway pseudopilin PulG